MYCQHCGEHLLDGAQVCQRCGRFPLIVTRPAGSIDQDPGMRLLLPVGRSPWAILAGYAGLFAVLGIFAPFALILGIIAVVDIKRHPEKRGMGRAIFGIIMGMIGSALLVLMVIAIAADL